MGHPAHRVLEVLVGPTARSLLAPAVAASATISDLEPVQVLYTPGRRVTVRYDATVRGPDGAVAHTTVVARWPGTGPVSIDGEPVAVWTLPDDPGLPGLADAVDPAFARRALAGIGVDVESVSLRLAAYRPCSRAVIELEGGDFFLKVVPADEAARVLAVHRALAATLPVARCHEAGPGVLLLEGLPGITLGRALRSGAAVPPVDAVLGLTARLAEVALPGPRVADAGRRRLERHAGLLREVLPEEASRIDAIVAWIGDGRQQPLETVHGDLHESQVLVSGGEVSGLLDVDGAGPGERVDDLALLAGRVWVLGHERRLAPVVAYAEGLLRAGAGVVDPGELQRRVGIALLGRVTGPFRNQLASWRSRSLERLALAERWVART